MKTWLIKISSFGTQFTEDDSLKRRIVFSNIIFLTLPVVYIFLMLLDYETFFKGDITLVFDQFIVPIIIVVCAICLILNRFGFTSLSKIIFLVLWPLFLHIIPIITQQTPSDYYLAFPLGIIFHAVLVQISFSQKKEPVKFWFSITINLFMMVYALDFLSAFDQDPPGLNAVRIHPYYTYDGIIYWLLFNLLVFYLLIVVENSIETTSDAKNLIEDQKEKLAQKNSELEQAVISLKDLNNYVEELNKGLEEKVHLRTNELEVKNQKLVEYASYNAHQLRGPFCRIKGLVYLQQELRGEEHTLDFQQMLTTSLDEMDEVITHIQKTVSTESLAGLDSIVGDQKS